MQIFDDYSSMNSLTAGLPRPDCPRTVTGGQILIIEKYHRKILIRILLSIPNSNRLTKFIQIQKWQVIAVSCIHAFSSPS